MTLEIGRLCVKIAGRDAKGKCVIVDTINDNFVLIDGQVRRRKCNINHLEPLDQVLKIKKGAAHDEIIHEFKRLGIEMQERKSKPKTERPKKQRRGKPEKKVEENLKQVTKKSQEKPNKVPKKESKKSEEKRK